MAKTKKDAQKPCAVCGKTCGANWTVNQTPLCFECDLGLAVAVYDLQHRLDPYDVTLAYNAKEDRRWTL